MNTLTASILFAFINSIILVVIYYYLHRQYDERALKIWAMAWLVYSLRFLVLLLARNIGDSALLQMVVQALSLVSGIVLLYGMYIYTGRGMPAYWKAGFIACMIWVFLLPVTGMEYLYYALPVSAFLGAVFLWTGIAFLKSGVKKNLGALITGIAFIVWAFHKLDNPLLRDNALLAPLGYFISSTIIVFVAVGILISYFEKVRFRLLAHEKSLDSALLDSIRRETQIMLILEGAQNVLENRSFGETAGFIFESCRRFTGATGGYVALLSRDERNSEILFPSGDREGSGSVDGGHIVAVGGIHGKAYDTGKVVYDNAFPAGDWDVYLPSIPREKGNVMFAPMVVDGKTVGLIALANKIEDFDDNDAQITQAFANLASIALMNSISREMLEKSESRFRTLVESMHDVVFTLDRERRFSGIYGRWASDPQVGPGYHIGKNALDLWGDEAGRIHHEMSGRALGGENVTYEWSIPAGESVIHMQTSLSPLRDGHGKINGIVGVGRDITRLKQVETRLEDSLREKDLLLKEVHHRVKNNMQVISSLINLQAQRTERTIYRNIFEETSSRVRAMALVHEKLYQSRDFARINFREYVRDLVDGLVRSHGLGTSRIGLDIAADEVDIGIDKAIPCAQIINELVSNSLKYAFPGERSGRLSISFSRNGDRVHTLTVADDGIGIPPGFDPATSKTLGLQLVYGLVKQLRGSIELDTSSGSRFVISFK